MADNIGNYAEFVDKRGPGSTLTGDYRLEATMNTTLTGAGYTTAQLASMTINDKVYAVRLISDAASI
jgi:hypothetical protein